jgi:sugar lactone lactonase YvrE
MFVSGRSSASVHAYDLTTSWDLSTATPSDSFDVTSEDDGPSTLAFKDDGTKLFVGGVEFDNVYSYDLSTAWDLSTASFNTSFDVSGLTDFSLGIAFESDGTTLFVCGETENNVYSYNLSTAWDLSTASFSTDITVDGQDPSTVGVAFRGDGTMMFVSGDGNDRVYSYNLSSAWDLSTASFDTSLDVSAEDGQPQGIALKSDGTKLFLCGASTDNIYSYALSTAWDLSTASPLTNLDVLADVASPSDLAFKDDGTKLFICGVDYANVRSFSLSTAWDLSTADPTTNLGVPDVEFEPRGLAFEDDGTTMYVLGASTGKVYSYSLSTAWDLSSATLGFDVDVSDEVSSPRGLALKDADWRLYMGDNSQSDIHEFARDYDGTAYAALKRA